MLLFNFKLFFKIAVAVLTGNKITNTDSTSADTIIKSEAVKPATEMVQLENKQENVYKINGIEKVSLDSLSIYPDTPVTFKEVKGVSAEK